MTGTAALIRKIHAAVTAEREQRKRLVAEQHARLADMWRRGAIKTLCGLEVAFVQAAQAGVDLDCLAAKVRALTRIPGPLPSVVRHFRAGGMDVTADQLADQIIASMLAVTDGRIMSALPPKADIRTAVEKGLLMTLSGHWLHTGNGPIGPSHRNQF